MCDVAYGCAGTARESTGKPVVSPEHARQKNALYFSSRSRHIFSDERKSLFRQKMPPANNNTCSSSSSSTMVVPAENDNSARKHVAGEKPMDPQTPITTATVESSSSALNGQAAIFASIVSPGDGAGVGQRVGKKSSTSHAAATAAFPPRAFVTPPLESESPLTVATTTSSSDNETDAQKQSPRRALFTPPSKTHSKALVTPSSSRSKRQQVEQQLEKETPPAKRRLLFGRLITIIESPPNVKTIYGIIRKLTGSIGGNGYSGPIYGELTMGSMQKMVDNMMEHTFLDKNSRFIDVGSGIGKPNLHVAQYPGVAFSCGVEMEQVRWSLGMTCLRAILDAACKQQQQQSSKKTEESIQGRCVFLHRNIMEAKTFDPFTHVYMFSIGEYTVGGVLRASMQCILSNTIHASLLSKGFPPPLWVYLSEMWNRSQAEYMICYHGPKDMIHSYEFDLELITQLPTSMHGSKEGHMGYIYKRKTPPKSAYDAERCDDLFQDSWNLVQSGFDPLHQSVTLQVDENMCSGPKTRSRKVGELTR
jgi:hypothetical protein